MRKSNIHLMRVPKRDDKRKLGNAILKKTSIETSLELFKDLKYLELGCPMNPKAEQTTI